MPHRPVLTAAEVTAFLDREFPQLAEGGASFFLESVSPGAATMRLAATARHLRPGGTVSGPSLMALADVAGYAVVLAHAGPVALAVTTNLTINFMRRPPPGDVIATGRLMKLGRQLAVVECGISAAGAEDLVAHAVMTYALPPAGSGETLAVK